MVCGRDADGIGYVLADASVGGLEPEGWARRVAAAAAAWGAHKVVAEANNGGEMVASVLRAADAGCRSSWCTPPTARSRGRSRWRRLFESGRALVRRALPGARGRVVRADLGGGYQGPGRSPDRADAMVWALTELMLGPRRGTPRVIGL